MLRRTDAIRSLTAWPGVNVRKHAPAVRKAVNGDFNFDPFYMMICLTVTQKKAVTLQK